MAPLNSGHVPHWGYGPRLRTSELASAFILWRQVTKTLSIRHDSDLPWQKNEEKWSDVAALKHDVRSVSNLKCFGHLVELLFFSDSIHFCDNYLHSRIFAWIILCNQITDLCSFTRLPFNKLASVLYVNGNMHQSFNGSSDSSGFSNLEWEERFLSYTLLQCYY